MRGHGLLAGALLLLVFGGHGSSVAPSLTAIPDAVQLDQGTASVSAVDGGLERTCSFPPYTESVPGAVTLQVAQAAGVAEVSWAFTGEEVLGVPTCIIQHTCYGKGDLADVALLDCDGGVSGLGIAAYVSLKPNGTFWITACAPFGECDYYNGVVSRTL